MYWERNSAIPTSNSHRKKTTQGICLNQSRIVKIPRAEWTIELSADELWWTTARQKEKYCDNRGNNLSESFICGFIHPWHFLFIHNLLSSSLLHENIKIKVYITITLPDVLYGFETWSLTLREEQSRHLVFRSRFELALAELAYSPEVLPP